MPENNSHAHVARVPAAPEPVRPDAPTDHALAVNLPRVSAITMAVITITLLSLLAALFFIGWIPHSRKLALANLSAKEASERTPTVEVLSPRAAAVDETLLLPGDLRANQSTAIFARASGYLKPLPAGIDIGAKVTKGQVIAEIASPELDTQLDQAKATLEQVRTTAARAEQQLALAVSTRDRYESAFTTHAVSQQELDERRNQQSVSTSALAEARASVVVAEAAVKRLTELQSFETVTAPFSGTITARGYDSGALISSGDAGGGKELFRIEQTDVLRADVNIPQSHATDITIGQTADLLVRNFPGRTFPGTIARSAGSIDQATRTLRVEIDVPNADGTLLPGMYVEVRFHVHRETPPLILPTSALLFGSSGVTIAVLEGDRVRIRKITTGRDFGAEAEILGGLSASDVVINNPGILADGQSVSVGRPK
jgi:RND family efflux transporter MFP subunit